ncbi:MAG: TauD/TfdA family dioxygenase [Rhodospirillaceae bacterium]|jgi:taurine dioxygenase|nr:TauD/TfdA family dioxygenase [Rhodospirillaceae bacterium]MBT5455990.1 TauD/TfdA family dioxygenase [Rhodospirillaceae bacterium]
MATADPTDRINVTPLEAPLGASVTGVDLSRPLSEDLKAAITKAWHDNIVLVFPDQDLSGSQQIAFARLFGPIKERGRPKERRPEIEVNDYESQVMYISNVKEDGKAIGSLPDGEMWFHHDGCYKEHPQRASFLYAIELPSVGGNTKFANMYKAYDAVPEALKKLLADKTALHVYDYELRAQFDIKTGLDGVAHWSQPLFIRHPDTGRTALYTNRLMTARINELSEDESKDVLAELFAIGEDPSVVYEHVWTVGDFVMWDNLCSMHARTDFPAEERRLLRRCVIEGEPTIAG